MNQQSDMPDTPPEVLARQGSAKALTAQTAELIGSREYLDDSGKLRGAQAHANASAQSAARAARGRAEDYAGGTPVAGLKPERVAELKGKNYEDAPAMESALGDRTPAFVNWLWAKHPDEAKVRYAYRDIWPTALPLAWPPKAEKAPAPVTTPVAAQAPAPRQKRAYRRRSTPSTQPSA